MKQKLGIFPFILSAVLFVSRIFTLFSLLPLLFLQTQKSKKTVFIAFIVNFLVVGIISGVMQCQIECSTPALINAVVSNLAAFFLLIGIPLYFLPKYYFEKNQSIEKSILFSVLWVLGLTLLLFFGVSILSGQSPLEYLNQEIGLLVNQVMEIAKSQEQALTQLSEAEIRSRILNEVPSYVVIFLSISMWANLMFLMRITPLYFVQRKGESLLFVKNWKAPEWLVWPTILAGATMLYDFGWPSSVASNFFRVFMMIYGFQGLSVLSCVMDRMKLKGILRTLFVILMVWPFLPLLLAVGFFDLWFDFRAKLRQS